MRANRALLERRPSPGFPAKQGAQAANLDTLVREEESGIVRREQANHLVPQQLLQTPAPAAETAPHPSAEFEGEFWDTAPRDVDASADVDADADLDLDLDAAANARPVVIYARRRRLGAIVGFAIVFSVAVILLLGEALAWLWQHG